MNGHCSTCDEEALCGYPYKPCDCRDKLKFRPLAPATSTADKTITVAKATAEAETRQNLGRVVYLKHYKTRPATQPTPGETT